MTLSDFLKRTDLTDTLLLGFYGGGNYGDELLMEVLAGLMKQHGVKRVSIAFQHPENYRTFHHEFDYPRVAMHDKKALLKAMLRKKHIIVGGGGLWGLDANLNILLMSILLFCGRWLLGKKVHLLAVGYYNSSPRIGRLGAWFAGKAANTIIARDEETYVNFRKYNKHTHQDTDIAWYIAQLDLSAYTHEVAVVEEMINLPPNTRTPFITLRRFTDATKNRLVGIVDQYLRQNQGQPIIVGIMEPRWVDPEGYNQLVAWRRQYPHVQIIDFTFNPLALFLFFRAYHNQLVFVGPQFHAILSAHLTGVPYLPLAYDNKVHNLLRSIAPAATPITVQALQAADVQRFIEGGVRATA